jgi:hypothetical protein
VSDEEREYLNETIRNLNNQLVDALRERDEARRMICRLHFSSTEMQHDFAKAKGWDCFKEDGKQS